MDEPEIIEVNKDNAEIVEKKGKSIASLVLGIVSIVTLCFTSYTMWITLICAILGLVFGSLGLKSENAKGMAKTGISLSIIALVLVVIVIVVLIGALALGMGSIIFGAISSI